MTEVYLPEFFVAKTPEAGLCCCAAIRDADGDVLVDALAYKFFDPFGLACLGAAVRIALDDGRRVMGRNLSPDVGGYLLRMDVFSGVEWLDQPPSCGQRHDRTDSLVELTRLDNHSEVDGTADKLARAVVGHIPGLDPDEPLDEMSGFNTYDRIVEPLQYAFSELLENALTHAHRQGYVYSAVWVACQYYPSKDLIRLAVVDDGCGIRRSLVSHPDMPENPTDLEAIRLALRPRISCNRDLWLNTGSVNQGVGLTTTGRIAMAANGNMVVVSGDALFRSDGSGRTLRNKARWDGVAVGLECCRTSLAEVRIRNELPPLDVPHIQLRFE